MIANHILFITKIYIIILFWFFIRFWFYSRTPGSRQPSPADETIARPQTLLDPITNNFHQHHFQQMLNTNMDLSYHLPQLHHQIQGPVMNGLQVPQVQSIIFNWIKCIMCYISFVGTCLYPTYKPFWLLEPPHCSNSPESFVWDLMLLGHLIWAISNKSSRLCRFVLFFGKFSSYTFRNDIISRY